MTAVLTAVDPVQPERLPSVRKDPVRWITWQERNLEIERTAFVHETDVLVFGMRLHRSGQPS